MTRKRSSRYAARNAAVNAAAEIPALPPGVQRLGHFGKWIGSDRSRGPQRARCFSPGLVQYREYCRRKWLGAGLSHVLEHMLFKGTSTRPGSRIDQEVQEAGGYMNAYTSFDRTVYYINVPNTGAKVAIDILCDIMQNAALPADELNKELDVIRREMDMNQDDPARRAGRRLFESAYTKSPYRFTIIGYPEIFNELKPFTDIQGYYRERYVPNNMFYIVVGDVKADEAVEQIRAAFVNNKAKCNRAGMVLPREPKQTAPREIIEEAPIELGYFHFGWQHSRYSPPRHAAVGRSGVVAGQRAQFQNFP